MMGNYHVRFDGGFREKVSIQTTRPFTYPTMVVEVEVCGQPSLQQAHCVILVEIDVLVFDAAPKAFPEDVVEGAAIDADLNVGCEQALVCRRCFLTIERALHRVGGGLIIHPSQWSSLLRPNSGLIFHGVCGFWADKVQFRMSFNPNHQA